MPILRICEKAPQGIGVESKKSSASPTSSFGATTTTAPLAGLSSHLDLHLVSEQFLPGEAGDRLFGGRATGHIDNAACSRPMHGHGRDRAE